MAKERKTKSRGNGQGSVYKLPCGTWRAAVTLYYDDDGKRVYKTKSGFKKKKDALEYLDTLRTQAEVSPDIKFIDLYKEWSKQHYPRVSRDTEYGYKAAYKQCEKLYPWKLRDLKTKDLQAVVDECENSRRSKGDIKSLLNNMYKYALQNDYCEKNYAEYIKLPPKEKSKNDSFTPDEIKKFWEDYEKGNEFTGYILILIYTGMRYGELATMEKKNIFIKERYMIGGIKTEAGIDREIPIAEKIVPIVTKFYLQNSTMLLEMPEKVFYNSYHVTLERLKMRKLKPHCCRHTFSTLMANKGIQPAVIKETAGHEDYATTMIYTHIKLDEKLKAVNVL